MIAACMHACMQSYDVPVAWTSEILDDRVRVEGVRTVDCVRHSNTDAIVVVAVGRILGVDARVVEVECVHVLHHRRVTHRLEAELTRACVCVCVEVTNE